MLKKKITNYYLPAIANIILIISVLQVWNGEKIFAKLIFITIVVSIEIWYILLKTNDKTNPKN